MKNTILLTITILLFMTAKAQDSKTKFTINRQTEIPIVYEHAYTKPLINEDGLIVGRYETFDSNGVFYYRISYNGKVLTMIALSHFFFSEKNERIVQIGSPFERHVQATAQIRIYDLNGQLLSSVEKPYHAPFVGHYCEDGSFLLAARKASPDSMLYVIKFNKNLGIEWEQKFKNLKPQNLSSSSDQKNIIFIGLDFMEYQTHTILISGNGVIRHDIIDLNTVNAIQFVGNDKVLMGGGNLVKLYNLKENKLNETGKINIPVNVATDFAISISGDGKYFAVSHCHGEDAMGIDVSLYLMSDLSKLSTIAVSSDRNYKRYRILKFNAANLFEIYTPTNIIQYEYTTY